jgi:hypothetical protein
LRETLADTVAKRAGVPLISDKGFVSGATATCERPD